jgi:hypothetical protein
MHALLAHVAERHRRTGRFLLFCHARKPRGHERLLEALTYLANFALLLIKMSKWWHLINNSGMRHVINNNGMRHLINNSGIRHLINSSEMRLKNIGPAFARINLRHSCGTLAALIVLDT